MCRESVNGIDAMNRPEVGSTVTLKHGGTVRQYVVLKYTKHHVDVARKHTYEHSIQKYGQWEPLRCGYECFLLKPSGFRLGFFQMLQVEEVAK